MYIRWLHNQRLVGLNSGQAKIMKSRKNWQNVHLVARKSYIRLKLFLKLLRIIIWGDYLIFFVNIDKKTLKKMFFLNKNHLTVITLQPLFSLRKWSGLAQNVLKNYGNNKYSTIRESWGWTLARQASWNIEEIIKHAETCI